MVFKAFDVHTMQLIHSGKKYRNSTAGGIYLWVAVNECGHINKGTSLGRSKKTFWLRVKVNHIFIYASEERGKILKFTFKLQGQKPRSHIWLTLLTWCSSISAVRRFSCVFYTKKNHFFFGLKSGVTTT